MGSILNVLVYRPFSWILLTLFQLTGSYGLAILLFCVVIKLVLLPISMKSKKGMMQTARIQPKLTELQKKYKEDKQKQQEAMQKLYQDEGVNPMSGCLWSLLPLPIFFALYAVLREPMTYLMHLSAEQIQVVATTLGFEMSKDSYLQITLAQQIHENFALISQKIPGLVDIDFRFLGINLAETPKLSLSWPIIIPILSGVSAWFAQTVMQKTSGQPPAADNPAAGNMALMNKMMPLMSVWFGFIMPAAMGVYWIGNSMLGVAQDYALGRYYKKIFDAEDAKRAELTERRRQAEDAAKQETIMKKELNAQLQKQAVAKKHAQAAPRSSTANGAGMPRRAIKPAKAGPKAAQTALPDKQAPAPSQAPTQEENKPDSEE